MSFRVTALSYDEISKLGDLIVGTYYQYGIRLNPQSEVMRYVNSAKLLSSKWNEGDQSITENSQEFFRTLEGSMECLRIGSAIQMVRERQNLEGHLKKMLKGELDPTGKKRTEAKDFWFELSVLARLETAGIDAKFLEPPDIEFELDNSKFVIACKCAYSESNLKVQFRKATRQILRAGKKGIIALCVDALLDHSNLVIAPTQGELYNRIARKTENLLKLHEASLPNWINSRKVIGILLFASTLSIVEDEKTPREGQFVLVNNRCTANSPYFKVIQKLGTQLLNAEF